MTNSKYIMIALFLSSLAWGQYNEIEGTVIKDYDPTMVFMGEYIAPNELYPHTYANVLKDLTGLLISIGTFRTLIAFSLGKFERLIMLDLDNRILKFNRKHIDDIRELIDKFPDDLNKQRENYIEKYKIYLDKFDDSQNEPYYWNDNDKWEKIINAIRKNYIYVIQGDLDDLSTTQDLLNVIGKKFQNHSITLDMSNVPDYLETRENLKRFLRKLNDANGKSKTVLLTTVVPLVREPSLAAKKDWYYYSSDLLRYLLYLNKLDEMKKEEGLSESMRDILYRVKVLEDKIK